MATIRQKKAIANLVENRGNVSKSMRDAGYPFVTAKNPKNLTESKAFKDFADSIPDSLLSERHLELLNKREVHRIGYGESEEWEMTDQPDTQAVSKALDMAYKLKGSYAPEKSLNINIAVTDKEKIKSSQAIDLFLNDNPRDTK